MQESQLFNTLINMFGFLWIDTAIKGTVIVLVALVLTFCMRKSSASSRHLVWSLSLISLLVLPFLSMVVPQWYIPLPQSSAFFSFESNEGITYGSTGTVTSATELNEKSGHVISASGTSSSKYDQPEYISSQESSGTISLSQLKRPVVTDFQKPSQVLVSTLFQSLIHWLIPIWLVGTLFVLFKPLLGFRQLLQLRQRVSPCNDKSCLDLFEQVRTDLKIHRPVQLLCDDIAISSNISVCDYADELIHFASFTKSITIIPVMFSLFYRVI